MLLGGCQGVARVFWLVARALLGVYAVLSGY